MVADDPALPLAWSATENVAWTLDVPGIGWGSPVVWGDHVFVTSAINSERSEPPKPGLYLGVSAPATAPHRWMVYDVDFSSGRIRWAKEVRQLPPPQTKHDKNSFASETAVTDGDLLYVYSATSACSPSTSPATWSGPRRSVSSDRTGGERRRPRTSRDRL